MIYHYYLGEDSSPLNDEDDSDFEGWEVVKEKWAFYFIAGVYFLSLIGLLTITYITPNSDLINDTIWSDFLYSIGIIGLISGLLQGSTTVSGPPVALFLMNQGIRKLSFRANLAVYFLIMNFIAIGFYLINGIITTESINYVITFFPGTMLGLFVGIKLAHKVDEKVFKRIVLVLVLIAGLLSIASGFGIL